jgi:hypothetical protein
MEKSVLWTFPDRNTVEVIKVRVNLAYINFECQGGKNLSSHNDMGTYPDGPNQEHQENQNREKSVRLDDTLDGFGYPRQPLKNQWSQETVKGESVPNIAEGVEPPGFFPKAVGNAKEGPGQTAARAWEMGQTVEPTKIPLGQRVQGTTKTHQKRPGAHAPKGMGKNSL